MDQHLEGGLSSEVKQTERKVASRLTYLSPQCIDSHCFCLVSNDSARHSFLRVPNTHRDLEWPGCLSQTWRSRNQVSKVLARLPLSPQRVPGLVLQAWNLSYTGSSGNGIAKAWTSFSFSSVLGRATSREPVLKQRVKRGRGIECMSVVKHLSSMS